MGKYTASSHHCPADDDESPSKDKTERCSDDMLIRKYGYRIHERRGDREAVWLDRRNRKVLHHNALDNARAAEFAK